jgi:hypothetical protein
LSGAAQRKLSFFFICKSSAQNQDIQKKIAKKKIQDGGDFQDRVCTFFV